MYPNKQSLIVQNYTLNSIRLLFVIDQKLHFIDIFCIFAYSFGKYNCYS
jgi:hypothetical protein